MAWWRPAAWVVLGLAVVASCWGARAVAEGSGRLMTYAGASGTAAALTISVGAALAIAGLACAFGNGRASIGELALFAALAWFAPVWAGWSQGPLLVRSIGMLAAGLVLPIILHIALAYPSGRLSTRVARTVVVSAYGEVVLMASLGALLVNPFYDPNCFGNCTGNAFLVRSFPQLARAMAVADRWFTVGMVVVVVALCGWRILVSSPPARRLLVPLVVPVVLFATTVAAHRLALVGQPLESPEVPVFRNLFVVRCVALLLLAAALGWGLLRTRLQHRAVSRIAARLDEAAGAPGDLEAALGRAVGDPGLRIAYWLPVSERYVDARGRPLGDLVAGPDRTLTRLVRGDARVAVVSHARGGPEIQPAIGPAIKLALDNERLRAEGLAQLEELRQSRARIVETGDLERRRLERDLHDGAQQRLLAASYEIRLAATAAQAERDVPTASLLAEALDGTLAALEELRDLANGLYPAILEDAGLAPALMALVDTAPLALDARRVTGERFPAAVEITAYLLVVDAVEDAITRHASTALVRADRADGMLAVVVEDDGSVAKSTLIRSADRVGALGGTLEVLPTARRAEIPCA